MTKITPQEALDRLNQGKRKSKGKPTEFVRDINDSVYLFRRGNEGMVAPADDELPAMLGRCDDGDFTLELPPVVEGWLQDYADEVTFHQEGDYIIEDTPEEAAALRKEVLPLVKAAWNQLSPYNDRLKFPEYTEKCMVGCVAVTIGQIMQYWGTKGYKRGCTATSLYKWSSGKVTVQPLPPITCFDYDHLTPSTPKTKEEIAAVATLLEYVGKALKLDYSPTGTGGKISIYTPLLISRLRLGKTITAISASTLGIDTFARRIYEDLAQGRPVAMRGSGSAGAHSFLCDGYDNVSDRFHFNWGWGGKYNGYFAMTALNPRSGYTFNSKKQAVVGIQPEYKLGDVNKDGDVSIADVMQISDDILNNKYEESADINSDGDVSITDATLVVDNILGKAKF